jgi:type II secretory pathway component PulK
MWVVLVVAGVVLVMGRSVRVDALASANRVAELQAEAVARGALQYVLSCVDGTKGSPALDNTECEQVQVGNGYYWLLLPDLSDDANYYFGIRDEASRLNLNSANQDMLLALTDMTQDLAASIVAWRSPADNVSSGGAESTYYLLLNPSYNCKNSPFETIDELMLVAGATRQIVYGEDTNLNGVLDPGEDTSGDGSLDRGIFPYVTVYGKQPNTSADGQPRINVNSAGGSALSDLLRNSVSQDRLYPMLDAARRLRPFGNILDFYVKLRMTPEEFTPIADRLTTSTQTNLTGLINVNTAPAEVLMCLPGLDQNDADALVQARSGANVDLTSIAWVLNALTPQKAVAVGSYITTRSYQFSADIVSVSGDGRAFRRYRAVIDTRSTPAQVIYWRDMTALGWPLDPSILPSLRAGEVLPAVATTPSAATSGISKTPTRTATPSKSLTGTTLGGAP